MQPVDPAIAGIGPPYDPAFLLHAIDHAPGGGLLDFEHFGQLGLGRARPTMQAVDDQPLRAGQTERANPPIERGTHQPRDVGDQKPDMALVVGRHRKLSRIHCLDYGRLDYHLPNAGLKSKLRPLTRIMPDDQPLDPVSVPRRIMIMISIVVGSTLYSTTLLIASTLLPQMQGAMAATQDEIAWTMTFNILATAVATPMTGWLVASFGRRNVMVGGMALFSLATYLCGAAELLESLVIWRMVQGAAGAPVTPLSQTILFDSFPRHQHRMITSIYGMTVVIGPVIGPALGGYMAELHSWRWAFYGLVPVGVVSRIGLQLSMLRDPPRRPVKLDWIGFLSLSAAISCVQLVLSRGQRLDWYELAGNLA